MSGENRMGSPPCVQVTAMGSPMDDVALPRQDAALPKLISKLQGPFWTLSVVNTTSLINPLSSAREQTDSWLAR